MVATGPQAEEARQTYSRLMRELAALRPEGEADYVKRAEVHLDLADAVLALGDLDVTCWHVGQAAAVMVDLSAWQLAPRVWRWREMFWPLVGLPSLAQLDAYLVQAARLGHGPTRRAGTP